MPEIPEDLKLLMREAEILRDEFARLHIERNGLLRIIRASAHFQVDLTVKEQVSFIKKIFGTIQAILYYRETTKDRDLTIQQCKDYVESL